MRVTLGEISRVVLVYADETRQPTVSMWDALTSWLPSIRAEVLAARATDPGTMLADTCDLMLIHYEPPGVARTVKVRVPSAEVASLVESLPDKYRVT